MIKSKMRLWVVILSILMTVFAVIGLSACDIFGNNSNQQYAVIFDANGGKFADGSDTLAQYVYSGSYIAEPSSPSRTNYTFVGWSKNESDYEEWRFDQDKVKSSITLYAQWEQESGILLSMDGGTIEGKDVFCLLEETQMRFLFWKGLNVVTTVFGASIETLMANRRLAQKR